MEMQQLHIVYFFDVINTSLRWEINKRAAIFIAALLSLDFRLLSFAKITSQSLS